tara:strand:+ start:55 stop:282 length:228 start_codon:yes stop_codon:yes gene_type:complete
MNDLSNWVTEKWVDGTTQVFLKVGTIRRCINIESPEIEQIVEDKIAEHERQIAIWQKLLEEKEKKVNKGIDKDKI